jgi:hypothetical protein
VNGKSYKNGMYSGRQKGRRQEVEGRRQKVEGRGQRAEGRRERVEGRLLQPIDPNSLGYSYKKRKTDHPITD